MNTTFTISEVWHQSWTLLKKHLKVLIIASLIGAVIYFLQDSTKDWKGVEPALAAVIGLLLWIVSSITNIGYIKLLLNIIDGKEVTLKELYRNYKLFWKFFGVSILIMLMIVGVIIIAGVILVGILTFTQGFNALTFTDLLLASLPAVIVLGVLVVTAMIYISIRFSMAAVIAIDSSKGVIQSMRSSYEVTRSRIWKLLGLFVVIALINLVGVLLIGIGLLIAIPLSTLMFLLVYRRLTGVDLKTVRPEQLTNSTVEV